MFFDSNVIIDVLSRDARWLAWSATQIEDAQEKGGCFINAIVLAELSSGYPSLTNLRAAISALSLRVLNLDDATAFLAGQTFYRWRRTKLAEDGLRVLPDFLIGAHASILEFPLVTRDTTIYRRYFPELTLITPETHP